MDVVVEGEGGVQEDAKIACTGGVGTNGVINGESEVANFAEFGFATV